MSYDQSAPSNVLVAPALLAALCGKYEMLCELRLRPATAEPPRAELSALAAAFPGALRELDRVPLPELERRLAALRAVRTGAAQVQRWMVLQIAYHGFMRAVLRLRRLLLAQQSHRSSDAAFELAQSYVPASDEPSLARFGPRDLALILRPPGGRLNPWVLAEVARDQGTSPACIESALWDPTV